MGRPSLDLDENKPSNTDLRMTYIWRPPDTMAVCPFIIRLRLSGKSMNEGHSSLYGAAKRMTATLERRLESDCTTALMKCYERISQKQPDSKKSEKRTVVPIVKLNTSPLAGSTPACRKKCNWVIRADCLIRLPGLEVMSNQVSSARISPDRVELWSWSGQAEWSNLSSTNTNAVIDYECSWGQG